MTDEWPLVLIGLPLVVLLIWAIVEVAGREDLSAVRRGGWIVALLVFPVILLGAYIVVRPPRAVQVSGGHADMARAEAIVLLAERRQRGELDDGEYHGEVAAIASYD